MKHSQLVKLHSMANATRTFFYFHGMFNGDGFYCWHLANSLASDVAVTVIHPHGFDGGPIPKTVEEMALSVIDLILEAQPVGPFYLGGFCIGGLIAFETAAELKRRGHIVKKVFLIGTAFPQNSSIARAGFLFSSLLKADFITKKSMIVRFLWPSAKKDLNGSVEDRSRSRVFKRAYRTYAPADFLEDLVCVWGSEHRSPRFGRRKRWQDYASHVSEYIVPGDRFCVERAHVSVANIIRHEIDY